VEAPTQAGPPPAGLLLFDPAGLAQKRPHDDGGRVHARTISAAGSTPARGGRCPVLPTASITNNRPSRDASRLSAPSAERRSRKTPALRGLRRCAREDSNLHGPYGPQGPQPWRPPIAGFRFRLLERFRGSPLLAVSLSLGPQLGPRERWGSRAKPDSPLLIMGPSTRGLIQQPCASHRDRAVAARVPAYGLRSRRSLLGSTF